MEREGFLETRKLNPTGLGLIIAAHGVVLTALALAPPDAIPRIFYVPLTVQSLPDSKTPPDIPPPPNHHPTQASRIDHPPSVIPTITNTGNLPPIDLTKGAGDTGAIDPLPVRMMDPVFVQATIDPTAAGRIQPEYPASLARAEIEGTATVRVLIASDGHVKQVDMVSATDPAFFEATRRQALRYWRFRPATSDGTPTESWRTMTVRFRLQS